MQPEDETGTAVEVTADSLPEGGGQWLFIAFMGRIEYYGYVTEITRHGQPAYRIELPEKIWGGNPLAYVTHSASAWFSDRPVTEESVRKAWESKLKAAEERAKREAQWRLEDEQRALTAGGDGDREVWADEDNPRAVPF
jgi:hypothetical protein